MKKGISTAFIILITAFTLNAQSFSKDKRDRDSHILFQNYPNPFSKTTTVKFKLTSDSDIKIFAVNKTTGETIGLAEGFVSAGEHGVIFKSPESSMSEYICTLQVFSADGSTVIYSDDIIMIQK